MASNDDDGFGFGFGFGDPPSSSDPAQRPREQDAASRTRTRGGARRGRRQRPADGFSFLNPTDSQFEDAPLPRGPRGTVHLGTVIGVVAVALVVVFFAVGGGLPSALISLGLCVAGSALYALISARPSWLKFRSRPVAALGLVGALIVTGVGVSQLDPQRTAPAPASTSPSRSPSRAPAPVPTVTESSAPSVTSTPAASGEVGSGAVGDESPVIGDPAVFDTTALALLSTLPVKGRAPSTGYDRVGDFGEAWTDVDHNGCDTREDILTRDLTSTDVGTNCNVYSGTLVSPYTGATIAFTRGYDTSAEVQIDHLVALSDAWQTGAQQLTQAQRVSLANDPVNLLAVDGPSNQQKSDSDAASWLPANKPYRCTYVAHQISVKIEYSLWVTPAEHDAMARILATCPTMAAPVSPFVGGR